MPSFHNTYRAVTVSLDAVPGDGSTRVSALMVPRVQPERWSQKETSFKVCGLYCTEENDARKAKLTKCG